MKLNWAKYYHVIVVIWFATQIGCGNDLVAGSYACVRDADCGIGYFCEVSRGLCLPENATTDGGMSGDCRQATAACATGFVCREVDNIWACQPDEGPVVDSAVPMSTCTDNEQNGTESDVDCGGDSCTGCLTGQTCGLGSDCLSLICASNVCIEATCQDGIKNGNERAVDCGGDCNPCGPGSPCDTAGDCDSGVCEEGICAPPTCVDQRLNGSETGLDCGGDCPACGPGDPCN